MSGLASVAELVAAIAVLFGPPITIIYRRIRKITTGVEWLLTIHNYPHVPPRGHFWPQVLRERDRDVHSA